MPHFLCKVYSLPVLWYFCLAYYIEATAITILSKVVSSTAGKRLIEGTTSAFWGGGARYESNAYDLGDAHGKNNQGLILEDIRDNEIKSPRGSRAR